MQVIMLLFLLSVAPSEPLQAAITGTVVDREGRSIANAIVQLHVGGTVVEEVRSSNNGTFTFNTKATGEIRIVTTAPGFVQKVLTLSEPPETSLTIDLAPAAFFEEVQVTSSGGDIAKADPAFTMTVLSSTDLLTGAPLALDDALKSVPGFTLFRRTSSRVSNPTSQGLTLRGLGGSGASRSLVLVDGVPLNDPFGGWVYWDRIPQAAIDRVEVLRGGGSDLYGADAVGGVVQILTVQTGRTLTRALLEGGGLGTGRASLFTGGGRGGWGYSGAGEWFTTDGYFVVPEAERGAIDARAGSRHRSAMATLVYQSPEGWRFAVRGTTFSERRKNGTHEQVNDTDTRTAGGRIAGGVAGGFLSVRVSAASQGYDQTFSTIEAEPPRSSEDVTNVQRVPTRSAFGSAVWVRSWTRNSMSVGGQGRFIKGHTEELHLTEGRVLGTSDQGGSQRLGSAFVQGTFVVSERVTLVAGLHADGWHSASRTSSFSNTVASFNPRLSVAYRLDESGLLLRGSVYRSFRAPTLNELYRGFRVGFNVTEPNESLVPERLTAADAGLLFARGRVATRVTGFWNALDNTVTNVTLSTTPSLTVRQRQNSAGVKSSGLEIEGDVRVARAFSVRLSTALIKSRYGDDPVLTGFRVPQVPEYTVGIGVAYNTRPWSISGQLRVMGPQFEDDRNVLLLRRGVVVDALAGRRITREVMVFAACENLFDSEYDVGRTFTRTVGLPRAVRVGVQLDMPGVSRQP